MSPGGTGDGTGMTPSGTPPDPPTPAAGSPAERLRRVALELAGMAQTGLAFSSGRYDVQRYARMRELAADVLAVLADTDPAALVDALSGEHGYATPKLDVRGALFDERHRVLLVREAVDGRWTLPGGWADVLDTPRAAVEREFAEEAGLAVTARRMAALWDGAVSNGHLARGVPVHIWKVFFLCERADSAAPEAGRDGETTDVGFFGLDELPALSTGRVTEAQLAALLDRHLDPSLPPAAD